MKKTYGFRVLAVLVFAFIGAVFMRCDLVNGLFGTDENDTLKVTVSPRKAAVALGTTRKFAAAVSNGSQDVTWTVEGAAHAGTTIVDGLLTVAGKESATSLVVRAASVADNSKTGTATVRVGLESDFYIVETFAGSGPYGFGDGGYREGSVTEARFNSPSDVAIDGNDNVYVADCWNGRIRKITRAGDVLTLAGGPLSDGVEQFSRPIRVAVDRNNNVYVTDRNRLRISKITSEGMVTTIATNSGGPGYLDGSVTNAQFHYPTGVAVDGEGNVYVVDTLNHRIRKIANGKVSTIAGSGITGETKGGHADGPALEARFNEPYGVAVDGEGNVYVADSNNHRIRKITSGGMVTTIAGNGEEGYADGLGTAAKFSYPNGIAVDDEGNIYVADSNNNRIRKITSEGMVTTIAGSGATSWAYGGYADGPGTTARFMGPGGIALDSDGTIYVADGANQCIRKITYSP